MGDAEGAQTSEAIPRGWLRAPGVLAAERWLLEAVASDLHLRRDDLASLADPLRILVPSGSLRRHIAARLVRNGTALGVTVQTLDTLAQEVLVRGGKRIAPSILFPLALRRAAREEAALAPMLGLEAGDGALIGLVDDLLDAGLEPLHAEVLAEHLDALEVGPEAAARAAAAIRIASRLGSQLDLGGLGHRSRVWVEARESLEQGVEHALPARAILLYGFADATGVQADFLETLMRQAQASWICIDPANPSGPEAGRAGAAFGSAFRARLEACGPEIPFPTSKPREALDSAPTREGSLIPLWSAPDPTSEIRFVAERVRADLDAGAAPESIAIVARDLTGVRFALRTHLSRLAIPYSGAGTAGGATEVRRQLDALLGLLPLDGAIQLEAWLAAIDGSLLGSDSKSEISLSIAGTRRALHSLGLARLTQLAALGSDAESRRGVGRAEARRARIVAGLKPFVAAAAQFVDWKQTQPDTARLDEHVAWLERALGLLGWGGATPGRVEVAQALSSLEAPPGFQCDADEFVALLTSTLKSEGFDALGGAGGGIQVLSVMESRGRSFDALYLIGLNRGLFPRRVEEDALLPDSLRLRMRDVLPDLPVKREGFDEERFLLAQILSSSPRITLSYALADDEGRELQRSPLLDALERAGWLAAAESSSAWLAADSTLSESASPAEHALFEGLNGTRPGFARAFEVALGMPDALDVDALAESYAAERAASRLAILAEVEGAGDARASLGPYLGCVGGQVDAHDRREEAPFVTTLEGLARCPWQAFLRKLLRLEPPPDAVASLPTASDARVLGNVVHGTLDLLFAGAAVRGATPTLEEVSLREPRSMTWPVASRVASAAEAAANDVMHEEGISLPGYARVLAARAAPYLDVARERAKNDGEVGFLGTEVQGEARVFDGAGERRVVRFKADRVDRVGESLRLTDYKTGGIQVSLKTEEKRAAAFRNKIAAGSLLQAALYARACGGEGRYLYLAPDLDERVRELSASDDASVAEALDTAAATLFQAWDLGAFAPKLREFAVDKEPDACRSCDVKEACTRGDSGVRRRLTRFLEAEDAARSPLEQAAMQLWSIGSEAE